MPGRIETEEVSILLFNDGVPIPWVCLRSNPGLKCHRFVNLREIRIASNPGRKPIEFESLAPNASYVREVSLHPVFRTAAAMARY
jgi:hypothetical protein